MRALRFAIKGTSQGPSIPHQKSKIPLESKYFAGPEGPFFLARKKCDTVRTPPVIAITAVLILAWSNAFIVQCQAKRGLITEGKP